VTLQAGVPWLILLTIAYYAVGRRRVMAHKLR